MLVRPRAGERLSRPEIREAATRPKDGEDLSPIVLSLVPIDQSERAVNNFADVRSIEFRDDSARVGELADRSHGLNESSCCQCAVAWGGTTNVVANGLKIGKGFQRPCEARHCR
jgi:hypothetical protein